MLYDVNNPAAYLAALAEDWRKETLHKIRSIILQKGPDLKEGIRYKMLSYGSEEDAVFQLNAQKHYVSLYVGDTRKIDPEGKLLQGLDLGKGCIRFKKSVRVEDTAIDAFIVKTLEMWRRGEDIDC